MESPNRTLDLVERLASQVPADNVRAQNLIAALKTSVDSDLVDREEAHKALQEYEDAYNKLTSPANRICVFIGWISRPAVEGGTKHADLALIALGDQEYVAEVDPSINADDLVPGIRVRVNDAYAVVGVMPAVQNGALLRVQEVLEDGRVRVGSDTPGSEGRFVHLAASIASAPVKAGDEVRLDPTGRFALEHRERSESRDYFLEQIPPITWDQVGGQEDAIRTIRETIEHPLLHPELYAAFDKKPIKGILLYGPPGCGKTLIGKATAYNLAKEYSKRVGHEVKEYFMAISGPKILNMWLGETERMVREIFKTARDRAKEGRLVFVFLDEAESLLRTRSGGRYLNISNTVVPQFCAELDGLQTLENVVIVLTSNRPDYIDPAVLRPERIDRKVKVSRPDRTSATEIVGLYLHDRLPIDAAFLKAHENEADCARTDLIRLTIDRIWESTKRNEFLRIHYRNASSQLLYYKDFVSGALLKSVVDRAKDVAIRRAIKQPEESAGLRPDDLLSAVEQEYGENEIFPKSDAIEDWLQLLDVQPDNVTAVKPVRRDEGHKERRHGVL